MHSITQVTPGAFAYQCDMLLPIQCIANWECIRDRKSMHIHKNFIRENQRRTQCDWQPGDMVLLTETKNKLDAKATSLYCIVRTHTNSNVTMQKS